MMAPLRGLLAAILVCLALPIVVVSFVLPEGNSTDVNEHDELGTSWTGHGLGALQPFVPGTPPFVRASPELTLQLSRRDCLPNGTNFCFNNNNVNFCAGCGNCCSDSANLWCCKSDSTCCGSSCCAAGQTCNNGRCYGNLVTATVLNTFTTTVTRFSTKVDSVVEAVIQTSYINSIVEVTLSNLATQTDVTVVTATAVAKRSPPSPVVRARSEEEIRDEGGKKGLMGLLRFMAPRAVNFLGRPGSDLHAPVAKRQETRPASVAAVSTTTATSVVTEVKEITSVLVTTFTGFTTQVVFSTLYQTHTNVLNAQTTVRVTSTTTFTSRPPVTLTSTYIASDAAQSSGTPADTAAPTATTTTVAAAAGPSSPSLSTPTIIGIAVGSAAFAALAAAAIYGWFAWQRKRARRAQEYEDAYYGLSRDSATYGGGGSGGYGYGTSAVGEVRQPRIPSLLGGGGLSPQNNNNGFMSPGGLAAANGGGGVAYHNRSSSGFTGSTAVGGIGVGGGPGGGVIKDVRVSQGPNGSLVYNVVELAETGPVEVSADAAVQPLRYEADGVRAPPSPAEVPGSSAPFFPAGGAPPEGGGMGGGGGGMGMGMGGMGGGMMMGQQPLHQQADGGGSGMFYAAEPPSPTSSPPSSTPSTYRVSQQQQQQQPLQYQHQQQPQQHRQQQQGQGLFWTDY